jgi:excisionase family DNA binding protein
VTSFGTCYAADGFNGAFAELFGRHVRLLSSTDQQSRAWSTLQLQNDADYVDMSHRTILGVSSTTVVRLIDAGKLRAHMVGTHRRATLADVLAHRDASARRRHEAPTS